MAKAGATTAITENDKSFNGLGIEGQKDLSAAPTMAESPVLPLVTDGATSVISHRDGGPKRIWFRSGEEIGFENVG